MAKGPTCHPRYLTAVARSALAAALAEHEPPPRKHRPLRRLYPTVVGGAPPRPVPPRRSEIRHIHKPRPSTNTARLELISHGTATMLAGAAQGAETCLPATDHMPEFHLQFSTEPIPESALPGREAAISLTNPDL